jgi:hypothetical protein
MMDKLILQWMFVAVWIIVVVGIAIYPMWAHEYRKIQRLRAEEERQTRFDAEFEAFWNGMTDDQRAKWEQFGARLADVVNASTISIKDIDL